MPRGKLIIGLCFILLHSFNLIGQDIKIKVAKSTYKINDTISVVYEIDKKTDFIEEIDLSQFDLLDDGPQATYTSTYSGGREMNHERYCYRLTPIKTGRIKLPKLTMHADGKLLTEEEVFIEVTGKELTEEEMKPKEYKEGHPFYVSLPDYLRKEKGKYSYCTNSYRSASKDVVGSVEFYTKEDLKLTRFKCGSIDEYYGIVIKEFRKDEQGRKVSKPQSQKRGEMNFIETDVTFIDKESNREYCCFLGIAETQTAFYGVVLRVLAKNKDKFKADFQGILYSIKE